MVEKKILEMSGEKNDSNLHYAALKRLQFRAFARLCLKGTYGNHAAAEAISSVLSPYGAC